MNVDKKISLILFLSACLVGLIGIISYDNFQFLSSIPLSNTSFTRSMVLNRALNLDGYIWSSGVDVVKYSGHYYPAYPPGYSFLAAIPYSGLQVFNYLWVHLFKPINGTISMFLESFTLELPSILSMAGICVLVYKILCFYGLSRLSSAITAWAVPFTTFLLGYLPSAFFHLPAAFFLLLGFYLFVSSSKYSICRALAIGLTFGVVTFTEYVPALCFIPLGIAFLWKTQNLIKSGIVLLGFLCGLAVLGTYNLSLFGAPWHFGEQWAATSNTREATSYGISFNGNPLQSLSGNFLSANKGLVTHASILILAPLGFVVFWKKHRRDALLITMFSLIVVGVYAFWHDWGGGWSLGPRFYTSLIPFWFILTGFAISVLKKSFGGRVLIFLLMFAGTFSAFWFLMMGPRVIVPKATANYGLVALQRLNRLPVILHEGPTNPLNVAPFLIQKNQELPLLSKLPFMVLFYGYCGLLVIIILGSLSLLLTAASKRMCNDIT